MALFEVFTNEGRFNVHASSADQVRSAMYEYIKVKRVKDVPLDEIHFAWRELHATATLNGLLAKA